MRYFIVHKQDEKSLNVKNEILNKFNGILDEDMPEVVFSIGGDGTVLDVIGKYQGRIEAILIVSIHTGNLGFYTEFLPNEIDHMLKLLTQDKEVVEYALLAYEVSNHKGYALNELTISGQHHMIKAEVYIDETYLMQTRGNGICISTPTGSTAYNKALGGAVLDNDLKAIQLTLIAPFETAGNKVIYPLVISDKHEFVIKPSNPKVDLSFDRRYLSVEDGNEIKVKLSDVYVKFLKNHKHGFANRINKTFIGNN